MTACIIVGGETRSGNSAVDTGCDRGEVGRGRARVVRRHVFPCRQRRVGHRLSSTAFPLRKLQAALLDPCPFRASPNSGKYRCQRSFVERWSKRHTLSVLPAAIITRPGAEGSFLFTRCGRHPPIDCPRIVAFCSMCCVDVGRLLLRERAMREYPQLRNDSCHI